MGKLFGILSALFVALILCSPFNLAAEKVWESRVPSSGASVTFNDMEPGATYYIVARGAVNFGTWWKNGRTLLQDPCYEFNAQVPVLGGPASLPVFKNTWNIAVCDGTYKPDHVYKSANFKAEQRSISFNIYDTDYRDNSGFMIVEVHKVSDAPGSDGGGDGGGQMQSHYQGTGDGYYVVTRIYFPDLSKFEQMPEGADPREYIQSLDTTKFEFKAADDPTLMFIDDSAGLERSQFSKGYRFAIPIDMQFSGGPEKKSGQIKGHFLMEVIETTDTLQDATGKYPSLSDDEDSVMKLEGPGGMGAQSGEEDGMSQSITVGPIEDGWSPDAQTSAILLMYDMLSFFGCFIASAVYENPVAEELDTFRDFRDKVLKTSEAGQSLIAFYYKNGPGWAQWIKEQPVMRVVVKETLDGVAWVIQQMDLDSPQTRHAMHLIIEGVNWILSPWMGEEEVRTPQKYELQPF